jgi:hypothetical protein
MINDLNWQTLEQRRNISAVTYLYKIRNNIVFVDHQHLNYSTELPDTLLEDTYVFGIAKSKT